MGVLKDMLDVKYIHLSTVLGASYSCWFKLKPLRHDMNSIRELGGPAKLIACMEDWRWFSVDMGRV